PPRTSVQILAYSSGSSIKHCEAFQKERSYGVQFHPERTRRPPDENSRAGLKMLKRWIRVPLAAQASD
ncbi:MAG TPA: hypothetical protein VFA18_11425, partial [Gemmataceae bacterium]|nr:hypothetical protein [Gemmataceae bacterium]